MFLIDCLGRRSLVRSMKLISAGRQAFSKLSPAELVQLLARYATGVSQLRTILGVSGDSIRELQREFISAKPFRIVYSPLSNDDHFKALALYVVCRVLQPRVVVETGVASGISTLGILYALWRNESGRLFSIDLPGAVYDAGKRGLWKDVERGDGPGWLVPKWLMARWELIVGASSDKLAGLVQRIAPVDVFYHDSEHTFENVDFELRTVWPAILPGGFILVDNSNWNEAFSKFVRDREWPSMTLFPFVGVTRRPVVRLNR